MRSRGEKDDDDDGIVLFFFFFSFSSFDFISSKTLVVSFIQIEGKTYKDHTQQQLTFKLISFLYKIGKTNEHIHNKRTVK